MQPRGIIFDCDGTLADTMPPHYQAWATTLERYKLALSEDRFYELGGWPTLRIAELLVTESGQDFDPAQIAEEKEAAFRETIHLVRPIEPVIEIARTHRGKLPLAVATGGIRPIMERILRQIGVEGWFEATVSCEDVAQHKPHPAIFLEAARRLRVDPEGCLVYEDTNPGVEAARRAGMQVVDVRSFFTPRRVTA